MLKSIFLFATIFSSTAMADIKLYEGENIWLSGELLVCGDKLHLGEVIYDDGERIECSYSQERRHRDHRHHRGYRCEIRTNQRPYITGVGYGYDKKEAYEDALADCREQAPVGTTICFNKVPRCFSR